MQGNRHRMEALQSAVARIDRRHASFAHHERLQAGGGQAGFGIARNNKTGGKLRIGLHIVRLREGEFDLCRSVVEIPEKLKDEHKNVTLCADIVFVDNIPFFHTISIDLNFRTIEELATRTQRDILEALDNVFRIYNKAGYTVVEIRTDPEFTSLQNDLFDDMDIIINPTAAGEHVPEIERSNRVVKERLRALFSRLPYEMLPRQMVYFAAKQTCKWLNAFPPKGGVSTEFSPRMLLTNRSVDYNKQCKCEFGAYVMSHEEPTPLNLDDHHDMIRT